MAIRYSGDVEIRIRRKGQFFYATLRAPGHSGKAILSLRECGVTREHSKSTAYDFAAIAFVELADKWRKENGEAKLPAQRRNSEIEIRRLFQAPCPIRTGKTSTDPSGTDRQIWDSLTNDQKKKLLLRSGVSAGQAADMLRRDYVRYRGMEMRMVAAALKHRAGKTIE